MYRLHNSLFAALRWGLHPSHHVLQRKEVCKEIITGLCGQQIIKTRGQTDNILICIN